jgi:hypothetical protein
MTRTQINESDVKIKLALAQEQTKALEVLRVLRDYVQGFIEEIEEAIKRCYNVQQIFGVSEGDNHKEVFRVGIGIVGEYCKGCCEVARWRLSLVPL